MRRRRAAFIFWAVFVASSAGAIFAPRPGMLQATAGVLVAPVSLPAREVGAWLMPASRLEPPGRVDEQLVAENVRLHQQVNYLREQLDRLKQLNEDRQALGESLLARSVPARVTGAERHTLQLLYTGRITLRPGLPVLHYGPVHVGIAGLTTAVGPGGAQMRLITDPSMRLEAKFVRGDALDEAQPLTAEPPLVEGIGNGLCQVAKLRQSQVEEARLAPGDWAVLADDSWPEELQGVRLGRVEEIEALPDAPGFVRVIIRPAVELGQLREVMIVAR